MPLIERSNARGEGAEDDRVPVFLFLIAPLLTAPRFLFIVRSSGWPRSPPGASPTTPPGVARESAATRGRSLGGWCSFPAPCTPSEAGSSGVSIDQLVGRSAHALSGDRPTDLSVSLCRKAGWSPLGLPQLLLLLVQPEQRVQHARRHRLSDP
jgi:hypothetical protein